MPLFTRDNAREFSARGNAIRWAREKAKPDAPEAPPASPEPLLQGISLMCVRERLQALDERMAKAETDREWDNLSRAYERMFRVWCTLTQTPGPGNLRPRQERAPRAQAHAQSMPAVESAPDAVHAPVPLQVTPSTQPSTPPPTAPTAPEAGA